LECVNEETRSTISKEFEMIELTMLVQYFYFIFGINTWDIKIIELISKVSGKNSEFENKA